MNELLEAKQTIDEVDREIARLFVKRNAAARRIAVYKQQYGLPICDVVHENEHLDEITALVSAEDRDDLRAVIRQAILCARGHQYRLAEQKGTGMKFLLLSGPNLNLLGLREPEIYGSETYDDLCTVVRNNCSEKGIAVECFQSNHEGALVDAIQNARGNFDGILLNPAAYTHTSVALADALKAVRVPTVEIHLSDVSKREDFRQISYVRPVCIATVTGMGFAGYLKAVDLLLKYLEKDM